MAYRGFTLSDLTPQQRYEKATFYERLQIAKVGRYDLCGLRLPAVAGFALYFACLTLYIVARAQAEHLGHGPLGALITVNIVLHAVTGMLVLLDSVGYVGASVLLQTMIQGMATYITFSLASFGGFYLYRNDVTDNGELTELIVSFAALGCACVANSVMTSLLFAYWSAATEKVFEPKPASE